MDLYPASSLGQGSQATILNDLQKTKGMNGARTILTRPSSRIAVFDEEDDIFYIIQTDINNNKTVSRFRFQLEPEPKPEDIFASKEEINELKGEIGDVKYSIRELTAAISTLVGKSTGESKSGTDLNAQESISKPKGNNKSNRNSQGSNESDSRTTENVGAN